MTKWQEFAKRKVAKFSAQLYRWLLGSVELCKSLYFLWINQGIRKQKRGRMLWDDTSKVSYYLILSIFGTIRFAVVRWLFCSKVWFTACLYCRLGNQGGVSKVLRIKQMNGWLNCQLMQVGHAMEMLNSPACGNYIQYITRNEGHCYAETVNFFNCFFVIKLAWLTQIS